MSALSDYAETLLLDWFCTGDAVTRPTNWYVALFTTATDDAAGGAEVPTGVGYARQAVTFAVPTSGQTNNSNTLTFGPNTNTDWGTITHFAVYDAASGGNRLWHGALTSSRTIAVGDSLQLLAGNLILNLA